MTTRIPRTPAAAAPSGARQSAEVARLRESVHVLAGELAALREGLRRMGDATGIPLLPPPAAGEAPAESQYAEAAGIQARRRAMHAVGGTGGTQ